MNIRFRRSLKAAFTAISLAASLPAATQTLTILGGYGAQGSVDINTDASRDGGATWQKAYLTGWHPWGFLPGTNSWINFDPSPFVGLNSTTLYRVRFSAPSTWTNPKMTVQIKADNEAAVSFNQAPVGYIVGANSINADLTFAQNLQPGVNTIYISLLDYGGWVGFNYRIDLSVESDEPLTQLPAENAPVKPPVITSGSSASGGYGTAFSYAITATNAPTSFGATGLPSGLSLHAATGVISGTLPNPGTYTIGLSASNAGGTGTAVLSLLVRDLTPPVITAPSELSAEATGPGGAALTFTATAVDAISGPTTVTADPASGSTFPLGISSVALRATDAAGNTAQKTILVTVRDTTAPTIGALSTNAPTLWPPNHKMVPITVSVTAADAVGVASSRIVSVTSNEPDDGLGDGDTAGDIEVTGPLSVKLRAERSGSGNGRLYTITVAVADAAGNTTTRSVTVGVPKSQGGK